MNLSGSPATLAGAIFEERFLLVALLIFPSGRRTKSYAHSIYEAQAYLEGDLEALCVLELVIYRVLIRTYHPLRSIRALLVLCVDVLLVSSSPHRIFPSYIPPPLIPHSVPEQLLHTMTLASLSDCHLVHFHKHVNRENV